MNGLPLYILRYVDGSPRIERCEDLIEWATWFETSGDDRQVAVTVVGGATISTVFLGLDHGHGMSDQPLLFETGVFRADDVEILRRYSTWAEAEAGHAAAVAAIKEANGQAKA